MRPPLYAPGRTAIKFCGITDSRDAALARTAGADAIGVILAPSERRVSLGAALALAAHDDRPATIVAVVGSDLSTVDELRAAGFVLQFCSPIDAANASRLAGGNSYLRMLHLAAHESSIVDEAFAGGDTPLFDVADAARFGGTGRTFAWERVARCASRYPVVIAGGLNSLNVGACIRSVQPAAVDVRSGIEHRGRKSIEKMRAFVRAVREADRDVYAA